MSDVQVLINEYAQALLDTRIDMEALLPKSPYSMSSGQLGTATRLAEIKDRAQWIFNASR